MPEHVPGAAHSITAQYLNLRNHLYWMASTPYGAVTDAPGAAVVRAHEHLPVRVLVDPAFVDAEIDTAHRARAYLRELQAAVHDRYGVCEIRLLLWNPGMPEHMLSAPVAEGYEVRASCPAMTMRVAPDTEPGPYTELGQCAESRQRSEPGPHAGPRAHAGVDVRELSHPAEVDAWTQVYAGANGHDQAGYQAFQEVFAALWRARSVSTAPEDWWFLATAAGEVASCGRVRREGDRTAGLYQIATLPPLRGRGYAAVLTVALCRQAVEAGADTILLQSEPQAEPLYTRLGFRRVGTLEVLVTR